MNNRQIISITGTTTTNKNVQKVFEFFANPSNDPLWRTEINQSIVHGPLQAGVKVSEYSKLSRKASNNLIELKCVQWEKNNIAVFETEHDAPFYLKSHRQVRAISASVTEIIYKLDFDLSIVKYAIGFSLPRFLVSMKANRDMKKYLYRLDQILENN